jgi:hypothetical protein
MSGFRALGVFRGSLLFGDKSEQKNSGTVPEFLYCLASVYSVCSVVHCSSGTRANNTAMAPKEKGLLLQTPLSR